MATFTRREAIAAAGGGLAVCLLHPAEASEGYPMNDEMILIPAGPFLMGTRPDQAAKLARAYGYHVSWLSGETPQKTVELPAYMIDMYSVTNRQYAAFCKETGYAPRAHWHGPEPDESLLDHPVTYVNRADAIAYAQWTGKRLPTEAEWEKAARGTDGRTFPWGDKFDRDACHWNQPPAGSASSGPHVAAARAKPAAGERGPGTARVNAHPTGVSSYGVMDMIGNVAEWCADGPGPGSGYIKGGCWLTTEVINLRPAARNMSGFDNNALPFYGFRCVKEAR